MLLKLELVLVERKSHEDSHSLTRAEYKVLKKVYSLLGGLCVLLSALQSHCRAEMLEGCKEVQRKRQA